MYVHTYKQTYIEPFLIYNQIRVLRPPLTVVGSETVASVYYLITRTLFGTLVKVKSNSVTNAFRDSVVMRVIRAAFMKREL